MYRLHLLGTPFLEGPSGTLAGRGAQPRQVAVLAILAWAGESGITRDKMMGLLWPEVGDSSARHMLRDSVYLIRKALGAKVIHGAGELLRLNGDLVWSDIGAFREAMATGNLSGAAGLCRGPFLDGFYLKNGFEFEAWVESTRAELGRQHEEFLRQELDVPAPEELQAAVASVQEGTDRGFESLAPPQLKRTCETLSGGAGQSGGPK